MKRFISFRAMRQEAHREMKQFSIKNNRGQWQGVDVSKRPEMIAHELYNWGARVPILTENLEELRRDILPSIPWADDHFEERVCGQPLNPGKEWENWPWATSANKFRDNLGQFDHNYMERYWPKYAGFTDGGELVDTVFDPSYRETLGIQYEHKPHWGIRHPYGDLNDVVQELYADPKTRQAVLPIFFPEDTGYRPGRRKPCSLFYHFHLVSRYNRHQLDIVYNLRSCDLIRHFRDDVYLTVRLLLWVLDKLRAMTILRGGFDWLTAEPGEFVILIDNLHCFVNDMREL